jgi:hypothetical protein
MVDGTRSGAATLVRAAAIVTAEAARAVADPSVFTPVEAAELFAGLDRAERAAAAGKAVLAELASSPSVCKLHGHASAADHYAAVAGTSIGAARSALATSGALADLPATKEALLRGEVSASQGQIVADAATVNPRAEAELLAAAKRGRSHRELREDALRAKAAADADREATEARIHAARRCSEHTDGEGAWHLHARGTALTGSIIRSELDLLADQIFRERRGSGTIESTDAYRLDALRRMAENSKAHRLGPTTAAKGKATRSQPGHLALLHLDVAALRRGSLEDGERCELPGIGPISLTTARHLLGDAVLKLVISDGVDVLNVTSLTRGPTQAMRYAMLWTNPTCVVEGCSRTRREFDHVYGKEWATTRHTRLDELEGKCHQHHDLHTRLGWELVVGSGKRALVPPEHPDHPRQARSSPAATRPPPTVSDEPGPQATHQSDLFGDAA